MKSLQGRMLLALGATIIVCWIIAIGILFAYLTNNQSSIWDSKLQAFGTKILITLPSSKQIGPVGPGLQLRRNVLNQSEQLAFQVWVDKKRLVVKTPDGPLTALRSDFKEGFANSNINGEEWRVFSISDSAGKFYVQVGNPRSLINTDLRKKLFMALGINTLVLLLVGSLMHYAVRKALAPVLTMGEALHKRQKFDLTPLPVTPLPKELHPLIHSFNHLLIQLNEAVEGERKFIGDAAHELRTPLAALQAHGQIALRAHSIIDKDAAITKLLSVAVRSTRLSEQLLDSARMTAGTHDHKKVLKDLSFLIEHVASEFEIQALQHDKKIALQTSVAVIECDIDSIGILLRNLIDNALRYTDQGGMIRIRCGYETKNHESKPYLEISDNGCGVPKSEMLSIFQRFYRVPGSKGAGSGIGLSLVHAIAELHHATIKTGLGLEGKGFSLKVIFPKP